MQTSTTIAAPLYFTDKALLAHFEALGTPLPFGLVRLIQDRKSGCLGGVPYRQIGGKYVYNPDEIILFLSGLPIIQAKPPKVATKTGRPSAAETAEANRKNITVKQLRAGGAA